MRQTADRSVTDRDQEGLGSHRRVTKHFRQHLRELNTIERHRFKLTVHVLHIAVHLRRLSKKHIHRHIHRVLLLFRLRHNQAAVFGNVADHRVRAAFAAAEDIKAIKIFRQHGDHIALLALVAPDLKRAHTGFFNRDLRHIEAGAAAGHFSEFRHGVRKTAGTDVMNRENRVLFTAGPAAVDHFLRAAFHFRVAALHGVKVQRFGVRARGHRARGTAAKTDTHTRAAENDQQRADRNRELLRFVITDVADTAREHDRLMVAVADAADVRLKNTEVAGNIRTAKFVIEGRGADRTFLHDGERRRDAGRRAVGAGGLLARHPVGIVFPALSSAREMERGNREAAETGLRTAAAAGSAFVTDLTAGTGGSARERRNRSRMVMRLIFKEQQPVLFLAVDIDLHLYRAGINLFRFVELIQLALLF